MTTTTAGPSVRSAGDGNGATRARQNHAPCNAARPVVRYPNPVWTAQQAGTANCGLVIAVVGGTDINMNSNGESRLRHGLPMFSAELQNTRSIASTSLCRGITLLVYDHMGAHRGRTVQWNISIQNLKNIILRAFFVFASNLFRTTYTDY